MNIYKIFHITYHTQVVKRIVTCLRKLGSSKRHIVHYRSIHRYASREPAELVSWFPFPMLQGGATSRWRWSSNFLTKPGHILRVSRHTSTCSLPLLLPLRLYKFNITASKTPVGRHTTDDFLTPPPRRPGQLDTACERLCFWLPHVPT